MSMICIAQGLTPGQIEILDMQPALLLDVVRIAEDESGKAENEEIIRTLPREQRSRARNHQFSPEDTLEIQELEKIIEGARERLSGLGKLEAPLRLGKLWRILHYALTETEDLGDQGDFLCSGESIEDQISEYHHARLYRPQDIAYVSRGIEAIDFIELQNRLDFEEMRQADVYPLMPGICTPDYYAGLREDAGRYFLRLQFYLIDMSRKGNGLMIWVS